jgi:hypothetical protein
MRRAVAEKCQARGSLLEGYGSINEVKDERRGHQKDFFMIALAAGCDKGEL